MQSGLTMYGGLSYTSLDTTFHELLAHSTKHILQQRWHWHHAVHLSDITNSTCTHTQHHSKEMKMCGATKIESMQGGGILLWCSSKSNLDTMNTAITNCKIYQIKLKIVSPLLQCNRCMFITNLFSEAILTKLYHKTFFGSNATSS